LTNRPRPPEVFRYLQQSITPTEASAIGRKQTHFIQKLRFWNLQPLLDPRRLKRFQPEMSACQGALGPLREAAAEAAVGIV
jgi:hypothetical protein